MQERVVAQLKSQRSSIFSYIPNELLTEGRENVLQNYYRAQLRIACGQKVRAKEILNGLDKNQIFRGLEEDYPELLAAIDIAVRGSSNWRNDKGEPIEPLFRINHS